MLNDYAQTTELNTWAQQLSSTTKFNNWDQQLCSATKWKDRAQELSSTTKWKTELNNWAQQLSLTTAINNRAQQLRSPELNNWTQQLCSINKLNNWAQQLRSITARIRNRIGRQKYNFWKIRIFHNFPLIKPYIFDPQKSLTRPPLFKKTMVEGHHFKLTYQKTVLDVV